MVPYGEAGDCYSPANCPPGEEHSYKSFVFYSFHDPGKFSINLTGTGLRVADHSSWIGVGNKPSVWLQRIQVTRAFSKFIKLMFISF